MAARFVLMNPATGDHRDHGQCLPSLSSTNRETLTDVTLPTVDWHGRLNGGEERMQSHLAVHLPQLPPLANFALHIQGLKLAAGLGIATSLTLLVIFRARESAVRLLWRMSAVGRKPKAHA